MSYLIIKVDLTWLDLILLDNDLPLVVNLGHNQDNLVMDLGHHNQPILLKMISPCWHFYVCLRCDLEINIGNQDVRPERGPD